MKRLLQLILLCLLRFTASAQQDSVESRIILVGDAGALVNGDAPVLRFIRDKMPMDKKTTVVFLGDNLYREGLPDEQDKLYSSVRLALDSQIALVDGKPGVQGYMIPGNHDWENGGPRGYYAILRQQRYVDQYSKNVHFYPKDGCPGPVEVPIGNNVVLIIMDSQWWLHKSDKPGIESDCPYKTKDEVVAQIEEIITKNSKKLVLFACHHPFQSNGIHGGLFGIKQHIFPLTDIKPNLYVPLPIIGSIYPISRSVFGSPQDLKYPAYVNMVADVENVVKQHPHVLFVHGHEHTLQYLTDSNYNYIISGSGCKTSRVAKSKRAEFVASSKGFATLEVSTNKNVRLTFYTIDNDTNSQGIAYSKNIMNFSTLENTPQDTIAESTPVYVYKDSALVAASEQYKEIRGFKEFMMGSNYRKEWSTPVKLKVFNINKEKGGFKIASYGGGNETKALTLIDKKGKEWKLRTIDKDPQKIIPSSMRGALAKSIVEEMTSASYPYSALIVPSLAKSADVRHPSSEYFYVPDDPSFGLYQKTFANKVCLLEPSNPTYDGSEAKSTSKVLNSMVEQNDHVIYQEDVLRARLLDFFIADWDRHFNQWKWGIIDTGKGKVYYPIPKDRDEAFFYSDGLILKYAARRKLPFLKGFQYNIPRVNWLGYASKDFDRIFLNSLDKNIWTKTIREFQQEMSDSVIVAAVKKVPEPIYDISGETFVNKLKSRRELMMKEGLEYYDFLSRYVNVMGSNKKEYFKVTGNDSGVHVQVYAEEQNGDTTLLKYERQFDPHVTKEIRLYGLNDNDFFFIDTSVDSRIKLRMIGGKGNDTFDVKGNIRNYIYDIVFDENPIVQSRKTRLRLSTEPEVNEFDYREFNYQDVQRFPWINVGYNSEDFLMAGIGLWRKTYGFRKEPFATETKLSTLYAFRSRAYQIKYEGVYNHIFRNFDLTAKGTFQNPALLNFFGLGNETEKKPGLDIAFYRVRYKYAEGELLLRQRLFNNKLSLSIGPSAYHYWIKPYHNENRILEIPALVGLDSADVYDIKTYLGGKALISVNNVNDEIFPTRGIDWDNEFLYLGPMNNNSKPLSRFKSDMTVYASLTEPAALVAVLRLGGGHIYSDSFEYFQAFTLGANSFLRGYRKNRFSGSSSFYTSLELRYKLYDFKSYVIPGSIGLIGYQDIGRVWVRHDTSKKWHSAFGGGIYYLPFNLVILSATVAKSPEEVLFNFSIGTKVNLTF